MIQSEWMLSQNSQLAAGLDFRFIRQGLEEDLMVFGVPSRGPIPESVASNPGVFVELQNRPTEDLFVMAGARVDLVDSEVIDDSSRLQNLNFGEGLSISDQLGTVDYDQVFALWSAFASAELKWNENLTIHAAAGQGQRAPSLTELYALDSFMFLLQNGQNTILGNPFLNPEKRWQIDLGASWQDGPLAIHVNAWQAWVEDYISYEKTGFFRQNGILEQVNLGYVNSRLATLSGFEGSAEWALDSRLTVFGTISYVRGADRNRNGSFATDFATDTTTPVTPTRRIAGLPRGNNADPGRILPDTEPLPGIPPLESRIGVRYDNTWQQRRLGLELSARLVAAQHRVAASLDEFSTPGFAVWDLRGNLQLNDHIRLVGGVENLLDKSYQEHLDFRSGRGIRVRQPGTNFYFGSELRDRP